MSFTKQQVGSILETMDQSFHYIKEALQHNQLSAVYPVFVSVVEGLQAIYPVLLNESHPVLHDQLATFEQQIVQFAEALEREERGQLMTILQFQLLPQLHKLRAEIKVQDENDSNHFVAIGMFYGKYHPAEAYRKERIEAMMKEAERQQAKLYMFTSDDVDMEKEVIRARVRLEDDETVHIPLPDVIYNIFPTIDYAQTKEEKWLRERVPFTTFPVGNKLTLPSRLLRETNYGHLFIPFVGVTDLEKVFEFLKRHKKGVFKSIAAARGESIFFVNWRSVDRFIVEVDKKPIVMNRQGFENWVSDFLIPEQFILQEFKEFKTRDGRPYDIRAHVQKDGEGMWTLTKIYPRIGTRKGILSNISRGGSTEELEEFLHRQFSKERANHYNEKLRTLSLEVAQAIDSVYNHSIDELGLDLAIDETGRIWMHEANGGPQTTYHEEERAVHTIAYAKYLAENRMFLTSSLQKYTGFDDQFRYSASSEIPIVDLDDRPVVGLLYEERFTNKKFREACAIVSSHANCNFYAFRAKDIDYDQKVIRGHFFENFEWTERVVRYPDVVYDRLRMKGTSMYNLVYTEFDHLPFTHTLDVKDLNKWMIQQQLETVEELRPYLIPTIELNKEQDMQAFIEEHGTVILKPIHGSFAVGIVQIQKNDNRYIWREEDETLDYSWHQMVRQFERRNMYKKYLVQKYVQSKSKNGVPIDVRMHMVKSSRSSEEWVVAKEYVRVSDGGFKINTAAYATGQAFSGTTTYLHRFLVKNFPNKFKKIEKDVYDFAQHVAKQFDNLHSGEVGEQALDIAITTDGDIYLLEINANRPGVYGYEFEIARHIIPYAVSVKE